MVEGATKGFCGRVGAANNNLVFILKRNWRFIAGGVFLVFSLSYNLRALIIALYK